MPASYFDVDGTLINANLMHSTLYYMANQPTPLHSGLRMGQMLLKSPFLAWAELRDRRMFNELLFEAFRGMSEDRLMLLADDAFEFAMKSRLYSGSRDLIQRHVDLGHEVVLVSGALDFLVRRLADELGAHTVIANRLEMKDLKATGKLLRPVVAGPEKSRIICDHAREKGYELGECYGYSDSYSDVPMLSVVGRPAAVNPDSKLFRLARAYHWPVLRLEKAAS
jgi:HAD superfamily hydrolase (TIGR01490 family)